jgi:hypothetical protein
MATTIITSTSTSTSARSVLKRKVSIDSRGNILREGEYSKGYKGYKSKEAHHAFEETASMRNACILALALTLILVLGIVAKPQEFGVDEMQTTQIKAVVKSAISAVIPYMPRPVQNLSACLDSHSPSLDMQLKWCVMPSGY